MAGGQLIPHTLPNGKTVMVPDYLVPPAAPSAPALQLPNVTPPPAAPDMRLSDNSDFLAAASPSYRQMLDAGKAPIAGSALLNEQVAPQPEDAEKRFQRQGAEAAAAKARAMMGAPDQKNLKPVPKPDPRRESNVIADTASELYGKKPGGAAAPPRVDPNNLTPTVAEIKQERQPGQRLLPEQEWRLGITQRPKELYEVDPTVQQPTWGTEDPVMREKLTPLEKGATQAGESARREYMTGLENAQIQSNAQKDMLVQQSQMLDQQLDTIAQRRDRIAKLQDIADKRQQEANSLEPRTRQQVWQDQGAPSMIVATLGAALGAYGASLGHHSNWAMDNINKVLDSAVDDERYKAERAQRLGLSAKNDVERAMALYGDLDAAALESKNRKLMNVMAMTQNYMNQRGLDAAAKERGQGIYNAAYDQYLANYQQLADRITGKVIKEEATLKPYGQVVQTATPKPVGGGGGGPVGISGDKLRGLSAEVRSLAVKLPDGTFKFVRSPQVRDETQSRLNSAKDMIASLRQLQALRADKANTIPWTKKRGQIEAINSNLITLAKSKNQMGALDKGLIEFSGKQFGSPEQFNIADATIDGKLQENISMLQNEVRKMSERELDNGPFELTEGGVSEDTVHE